MDIRVYSFATILLPPLLIGAVTAFARKGGPRYAITALAVAAVAVLIVGMIYYNAMLGFRNLSGYLLTHPGVFSTSARITSLESVYILNGAGGALAAAAAAIALSRTAQLGRWRWFSAILLVTVLSSAVVLNFSQGFLLGLVSADLQMRLNQGDATLSLIFNGASSILIVLSPLASLLYGLRGPDAPKDTAQGSAAS